MPPSSSWLTLPFQLTTSRRGRQNLRLMRIIYLEYFNSRPHEEVDKKLVGLDVYCIHFNSRPHEEVDKRIRKRTNAVTISTHDLTKRSTAAMSTLTDQQDISTHDLTKRSTGQLTAVAMHSATFQLTTSRRGRQVSNELKEYEEEFQLTTSRRGRLQLFSIGPVLHYFNSRPHEEVDHTGQVITDAMWEFQLTTSRRGRRQFLRKKFSFPNYFLCLLHIIYSYYINTIFFSTLFFAKSSFFLVRIP